VAHKNAEYDEQTVEVMGAVLDRASCCVDVGAHRGAILRHMVELAPGGTHVAFEPLPDCAAYLRQAFPTVDVREVALGDARGRSSFVEVTTNPALSGLRVGHWEQDETSASIDVAVERLDDVVDEDLPVRFIKIDVEGAELGVLRGGQRTLTRWRPFVVFEHGLAAASYGTTSDMVFELLAEAGLSISTLHGWLGGERALDRKDFSAGGGSGEWYFLAHPTARRA
jgi:FkbM family methyltransferase